MPETRIVKDPKWRRLPEERPQQILAAAFEEFGEHGLAGARLDDIARRAGVAKGTIYLYFPNKEALFKEMIRHTVVARLEEAELELDALSGTAAEQVREYMRRWWAYLETPEFQTVYRLLHGELHRFPDLTQFYADEVIVRSHRLVSVLIARGVDGGEFRAVDIDVTARILAGMLITHSVWVCQQQIFKQPFTVSHEYLLGQLTDFFLHALRPDAGVADAPAAR
jgi:AcrR family transcriptional regulator